MSYQNTEQNSDPQENGNAEENSSPVASTSAASTNDSEASTSADTGEDDCDNPDIPQGEREESPSQTSQPDAKRRRKNSTKVGRAYAPL